MQKNNLGTLYLYELKKIMKRRLVRISLLICMIGVAAVACSGLMGEYYVDGKLQDTHYHMFQVDRAYREALSGRVVDQPLLAEMAEAYGRIPPEEERFTLTDAYQTYARPYSAIFNLVRAWTGMNMEEARYWEANEQELYRLRQAYLEKEWQQMMLSEPEAAFWREKEAQIDRPVTYLYCEGVTRCVLQIVRIISSMMLLFVAVSLSGVFAEEHTRRTDQLILTGAKGKSTVYYAKMLAGISIAVLSTLLLQMIGSILTLCLYGEGGYEAAFQLAYADCSYPLTIGQAYLIECGITLVTAAVTGVLVMVLSEALHSGLATLAVFTGWIIAGLVIQIPLQSRVFSQIWDWMPTTFLSVWNIFDVRTVSLFGHRLVSWQIVPALYLLGGLLAFLAGVRVYRRYQVSGR